MAYGWAAMQSVIVGLLGVLVGAFVSGWMNLMLDRRRDRARGRAAARLVQWELMEIAERFARGLALEDGQELTLLLDTPQWDAHKEVLAAALSTSEWMYLSVALSNVHGARGLFTQPMTISPGARPYLQKLLDSTEHALRRLPRHVGYASPILGRLRAWNWRRQRRTRAHDVPPESAER
jgi:hypothetical protein